MIEPGVYLLYDGRCHRCSELVADLEDVLADVVRLADLRDPEYRRLLDAIRPTWRFEPTLFLHDGQGRTAAFTGFGLRLRVLRLLGLRRGVRTARIARRYRVPAIGTGPLGVRPHPAPSPEEIAAVVDRSTVRLQPDVPVAMTTEQGEVRLRFLDREITMPDAAARDVEAILSRGHTPFSVGEVDGQLDAASRVTLVQMLLRERVLVAVQTGEPQVA